MSTLTGKKIKDTYDGLLKTSDNEVIPASGQSSIEDGLGNTTAISIGRANNGLSVTGDISVTGSVDGRDIASDGTQLDANTSNISTNTSNISANTTAIAGKVSKSGDNMTGNLNMATASIVIPNGSIYLGGSGSANQISDYEEGTYNPTFYYFISPPSNYGTIGESDASYWLNASKYTKIGDTVIISINLQFGFGTTVYPSSGTIYLDNLPFTPINMLEVQGSWTAVSLDSAYTADLNGNLGGSSVFNTTKVGFTKSLTTTIGSSMHPDTFVYGDGTSQPNVAKLYGHIIYKTNS